MAKVVGVENFSRALGKLRQEVRENLSLQTTAHMARIMKDEAIARAYVAPAPYRHHSKKMGDTVILQPGHIGRNISMVRMAGGRRKGYDSMHIVDVSNSREGRYAKNIAVLIEYGTSKMSAKPFMRPAFDSIKDVAPQEAKKMLRGKLERLAKDVKK